MLPLGREREKGCPVLHPYNESQLRSSTGRGNKEKLLLLMSKVADGAGTRQAAGNYAGARGLGLAAPKPLPHKRSSHPHPTHTVPRNDPLKKRKSERRRKANFVIIGLCHMREGGKNPKVEERALFIP